MMNPPDASLQDLLDHLELETRGDDVFRGHSQTSHNNRIFGGLVFAQAMRAAQATVEGREVHSAHAYFLRAGNPDLPIDYAVDRIRDGRSFTTRRVVAHQDGRAIFNLSTSFQVDETGPARQVDVEIPSEVEGEEYEDGIRLALRGLGIELSAEQFGVGPVQIRVEGGLGMGPGPARLPELRSWLRSRGSLPDEPGLHAAILAYVSDLTIVVPAVQPFEWGLMSPNVQSASLDHAIWFHDSFRIDDWLYAVGDSPVLKRSRSLGRVLFYSRDGRLVASAVQEGLIRKGEET